MNRTLARAVVPVLFLGALSACGGGSDDAPSVAPLADGTLAGNVACVGDYYRIATGTYTGRVEWDASAASDEGGSACTWEVELEIRERDFGTSLCELDARLTSTVEQSVVLPAASDAASECRAEDTVLRVIDPMRAQSAPVLGIDYTLPLRFDFFDPGGAPRRGPYFGDEGATVPYLHPFAGTLPLIGTLVVDEAGVTLEQSASSVSDGVLEGRLERVPE